MKWACRTLWILSALLFCSCQSVHVFAPLPSLDSPELDPSSGVSFHLGARPAGDIEISSNAGARPPDLGQGDIERAYIVEGGIGWTPSSNLNLRGELFGNGFPTGASIKGQFQFYGQSKKESKAGDSSASLTLQGSLESQNAKGDQESVGGAGHRDWSAKGELSELSIATSYGYRSAEKDLLFASIGYGVFKTNGKIHQSSTDTDPAADYDIPKRAGNVTAYAFGWDRKNSELSNFVYKIMYVNINHDDFNKGFAGFEFSAFFR
jgi:hypothetical protein